MLDNFCCHIFLTWKAKNVLNQVSKMILTLSNSFVREVIKYCYKVCSYKKYIYYIKKKSRLVDHAYHRLYNLEVIVLTLITKQNDQGFLYNVGFDFTSLV